MIQTIEKTVTKHNKPLTGFALGPPETKQALARGKAMISISADVFVLQASMEEQMAFRKEYPVKNLQGAFAK